MIRPKRLIGWYALAMVMAWQTPAAQAEPALLVRELGFKHTLRRVIPVDWEGRPAILALTFATNPTPQRPVPPFDLSLVRLEAGKLAVTGRWRLPRELRWLEPIRLSKGREALLALIGTGWYLGTPQDKEVRWRLLCRCESLFSAGKGLLPFKARFAVDLDGDGRDEVLLPHWRGLMVNRLAGGAAALQPLWRNHWEIREHYELRDDTMKVSLAVPRYVLRDANGDGIKDFIVIGNAALDVILHPAPAPARKGSFYVTDRDKLTELERLRLPRSLMKALEGMKPGSYDTPGAFRAALAATAKGGAGEAWAPHLEEVLAVFREPIPARFPHQVPLPALKAPGKKEKYRILTVGDMNEDGLLDLVHVKSTDEGELLGQKNQLRWYEGRPGRGGVAFRNKPQIFFSEGPAFAELVFPQVNGAGPPELFLATTEVSLMAIIRAFTLNEVSLDLYVYPWRKGKLVAPPPVSGTLVFELKGKGKKNRPMVLLADLTGDGRREYLFNMDTDTLTVFPAGPQGPDFEADPLFEQDVELPRKPDTIFVKDLDGDGKEELVLWHLRQAPPSPLARTLRVLQFGEARAVEQAQDLSN
jgi:hypothetical protein